MEETREEVVDNSEESSDVSFDIKSSILILVTLIVIFVCFFKYVVPALTPTEHAPSSILEHDTGDRSFEGLFD